MKNKILFGFGLAAVLIMTGCSKQPTLENAQNGGVQQEQTSNKQVQEVAPQTSMGEESVNTQNANVEEQNIEITEQTAQQKFAKELAEIIVYFDFDKYNIKPSEWPKVEKLAELIKEHPANYTVRIEGNCDEWGTEEYNYALGLKRANTVKNALIKLGVDPQKLTVISYGELNPVCTAHAKWCWKLNRRDNFTYLP